MTNNDTVTSTAATTGEERLKSRRKSFWRYLGLAFLLSLLAGLASGFAGGMFQTGDLPIWVPILIFAIVAAGFIWFTRDYFRRVDELDLMDNLWAHLIGFYGILIIFGGWYFLWELSLLGKPDALLVIIGGLLINFGAYGLRKLGLR